MQLEISTQQRNLSQAERWLSAGIGAAILWAAVRRSPPTDKPKSLRRPRVLLFAAGGTLAVRGLTGYCPAYAAMGIDATNVDQRLSGALLAPPSTRIVRSITIRRPVDEVFQFCNSPTNMQLAVKSLDRIERLADGYQRWHFRTPRGLRFACDLEVTHDQENGHLIAWRSREGNTVTLQGFLSFRPGQVTDETELRASFSYMLPLGIIGHVAARSLSPAITDLMLDALRQGRQVLEAKPAPPTVAGQHQDARAAGVPQIPEDWRRTEATAQVEDFEDRYRQATDGEGRVLH